MNNKITLPELAALLSLRTNISKKSCEDFLREYANTVTTTLTEGEAVRIKGFGTFKLNPVEPRKSVNVVSGEEMEIPGHFKVSFVPAKELAEAINAPFEAFEAVELADGLEDISSESENILETQATISLHTDNVPSPGQREIEETAYIFEENQPVPEKPADPETDEHKETPECEEPTPTDNNDTAVIVTSSKETEPEHNKCTPVKKLTGNDDFLRTGSQSENNGHELQEHKQNRFWKNFLSGILAGICISALAGFIAYKIGDPRDSKLTRTTAAETDTVASRPTTAVTQEIPEKTDSVSPDTVNVPTQPSDVGPVYDTITKTRYLTTMAKEHYGNYHLWPYIYEENKAILGHPDRIRPGTKVRIPSLSKYGIDPRNPEDIKRAKQMGITIYSRYR